MTRTCLTLCLLPLCWSLVAAAPAPAPETEIIFVGDSVTSGVEPEGNFPLHFDLPWARVNNVGVIGTSSTDINPFEQRGFYPYVRPWEGAYWSAVEPERRFGFPPILHRMFGVNDAVGVNETCARIDPPGPACPLKVAEYRGNLEATIEEIQRLYAEHDQGLPLILISSPTVAPVSGVGAFGPGNRKRLAGYEEQAYRLVKRNRSFYGVVLLT